MQISSYEKRIRERFPALVADPIWPMVENMLADWDRQSDDEGWFPRIQQQCIDLCRRLGLPFEPARCNYCDRMWPQIGDVPDGGFDVQTCESRGECEQCQAETKASEERKAAEKAAHDAWYEGLTPEERARHDLENQRNIDLMINGLISRDVQ